MAALIFVDTNILLDFYRVAAGGVGLELLERINEHRDILITGSQVEMEYKKNRQRVILEAYRAQKTPEWAGLAPPAFLNQTKPAQAIATAKKSIVEQQKKMKERIANLLKTPSRTDPVYQTLARVFRNRSEFNLTRDNPRRFAIRRLARKRFGLGYPPRKGGDTSIGDAVHWEWIVECARTSGKDVVIVTRDTDFGVEHAGNFFVNDWLRLEFGERVSRARKLVMTYYLADAFKLANVRVTRAAAREERELVAKLERGNLVVTPGTGHLTLSGGQLTPAISSPTSSSSD